MRRILVIGLIEAASFEQDSCSSAYDAAECRLFAGWAHGQMRIGHFLEFFKLIVAGLAAV